jgi:hypothetical protein
MINKAEVHGLSDLNLAAPADVRGRMTNEIPAF